MALKANYEFLFVGKDDNSFLDNFAYDLFQDYGGKSGQIFVNLEVQNNAADAEEIGSAVFETVRNAFFEDVNKDPYERFEVALKAVNKVMADFKGQKFSGYVGNLNIIIAGIVGNVLFLTQSGDAEAYLIRKRFVSIVSEGLSDEATESGDTFASIASGTIESGDLVLFSSTRLLRYVSKNDLAKCAGKKDVIKILEDVRDLVSTEILGRVGMTGILFSSADKDDLAAIEKETDTATQTMLESAESDYIAEKQTLTGRFLTAIKGRKRGGDVSISGPGTFTAIKRRLIEFRTGVTGKDFGKDKILALLVLLIIVLTAGIWIARGSSAERQKIDALDKALVSVQTQITDAETKAVYDKEAAKAVLDKAYLDARRVLDSGYFREKAGMYLLKIEEARGKMDNVQRVETPKLLADLSAKRSNVNALGLVDVAGRLFVYEYNALYEVVLDQIQDPLTIDDKETVVAATGFDDRNSLVFMTKTGKMIEYKSGTMSYMDSEDGSFHKGVAIRSWSNKIYLLDSANNQIWKYSYKGTQEKFGSAEGYLTSTADFSKAQDFAIDANIYVLQNNGDILKYYGGRKADFFINNPPFNGIKDPRVVYTNEKLDSVYVLDGQAKRVLVFQKDTKTGNLNYVKQYQLVINEDLRDIYVDPNSKKMDVVTATKLYQIDL